MLAVLHCLHSVSTLSACPPVRLTGGRASTVSELASVPQGFPSTEGSLRPAFPQDFPSTECPSDTLSVPQDFSVHQIH